MDKRDGDGLRKEIDVRKYNVIFEVSSPTICVCKKLNSIIYTVKDKNILVEKNIACKWDISNPTRQTYMLM